MSKSISPPTTAQSLGALLKSARDTGEKAKSEMLKAETGSILETTLDFSLEHLAFAP